jgi:hypothetical protein
MVNPASVDSKSVLVNDFSKSMMSSSRGDMINVKLKIIGDPEFIKQDDLFLNPANNPGSSSDNAVDPKTNSIIYDAAEVHVLLTFRTPIDFNPEDGLMDFAPSKYSVFSGVYKVITVENEFTRGQFTQSLDLVRLFDQPEWDSIDGAKIKGTDQRRRYPVTVAEATSPEPSEETAPETTVVENTTTSGEYDEFAGLDDAIARQRDEQNGADEFAGIDEAVARNDLSNYYEYEPTGEMSTEQLDLRMALEDAPTLDYGTDEETELGLT